MPTRGAIGVFLLWLACSAPAAAQDLKPYFLVIFDTSTSMRECTDGSGSANTHCPSAAVNGCGFPVEKNGDARCALQRILDATGDATFGLMQFSHPCKADCSDTIGGESTMINCDAQLLVPIESNNQTIIREWVDGRGNCQGSCTNDFARELTSHGYTPLGQSLKRAREYLRGTANGSFPFPTGTAPPSSPLVGDTKLACRPVSVILLTDGDETCSGNAPAEAGMLYTGMANETSANVADKAIRVYVIGFGNNVDADANNMIADAGGTGSGFLAGDEGELSVAFNQIIADAQPNPESCNNADDDCDMLVDEGVTKFCNKPEGIDDLELCDEPDESLCDGKDDDCDGLIDEGVLNVCGTCGEVPAEVCDAEDNDCDGRIDEDADSGEKCGTDVGICKTGVLECIGGAEICKGDKGGQPEACDCQDNDCDGFVDEDPKMKLCGEGLACVGCRCVTVCQVSREFMTTCPEGLRPEVQDSGECLCIADTCIREQCAAMTLERDDEVACAPDRADVDECLCRGGACVAVCDGVGCGSGEACNPANGVCAENNCRGFGCPAGEICNPEKLECESDPCEDANCREGQACRGGECEFSCAEVPCSAPLICVHGECIADPCEGVRCAESGICDPVTGKCIWDPCIDVTCDRDLVCTLPEGRCEPEPCWNVVCPEGQICTLGECYLLTDAGAGRPGRGRQDDDKYRLIATGGGGCSCRTAGSGTGGAPGALLLIWLCVAGLRRRRLWRWLSALFVALWLGGCQVTPYCFDCRDAGAQANGRSDSDAGSDRDGGGMTPGPTPGTDGSTPVKQMDGAVGAPNCDAGTELCNGFDDDCDFVVDEDAVVTENECEQLGVCKGTKPECNSGEPVCRYPDTFEMKETTCDDVDNDCDGKVDEALPKLGKDCEIGTGQCNVRGMWVCNDVGNGLECKLPFVAGPTAEICDGLDNDCDGKVDEPKSDPGDNPSFVEDDMVKVNNGLWIYKYEASKADATDVSQGVIAQRACSRRDVLPWTNLTFTEALDACAAADLQLCSLADWTTACETSGPGSPCGWGYTSSGGDCNSYMTDGADDCNGHDVSAVPGSVDMDALTPTGSYPRCFANHSDGAVWDLSGNAKEWTQGPGSPAQNPLRGGSYNNLPSGLRCDFDFSVAAPDIRLRNIGFRCCTDTDPAP